MTSARHYAREIESRWTALLERPALLGERDWSLICDWYARGIPLALIGEAFDALAESMRRRKRPPRSLAVLAPSVEEAWRTIRQGRSRSAEGAEAPHRAPQDCDEPAAGDPLARIPEELRDRLEESVDRDLAAFRDRMRPEIWETTRRRALISAARRWLRRGGKSGPAAARRADETF
ncbi:MAG: hypothetical protein GTN89_03135 [Acidobacteria bacterium]|nr:hypothetical protein [Acidobacteriota bacterium]